MKPIFCTQQEINALFNKSTSTLYQSPVGSQNVIEKDLTPLNFNNTNSQLTVQIRYTQKYSNESSNPFDVENHLCSPFGNLKNQKRNSLDSIQEQQQEELHEFLGSNYDKNSLNAQIIVDQDEWRKLSSKTRDTQQMNVILEEKVHNLEERLIQEQKFSQSLREKLEIALTNQDNNRLNRQIIVLEDQLEQNKTTNEKMRSQINSLISKQKLLYEQNSKLYDESLQANLARQRAETLMNQMKKDSKRKIDKLEKLIEYSQSCSQSHNSSFQSTDPDLPQKLPKKILPSLHLKEISEQNQFPIVHGAKTSRAYQRTLGPTFPAEQNDDLNSKLFSYQDCFQETESQQSDILERTAIKNRRRQQKQSADICSSPKK